MKSLNKFINESILDDEDKLLDDTSDITLIKKFLNDNIRIKKSHKIKIYKKNNNNYVDYTGDVTYKNIELTSLTNGLFKWGVIKGNFLIMEPYKLNTLEGAPIEVTKNFCIYTNHALTSLKGAPKKIGMDFNADNCYKLKTLDCPDTIVGKNFSLDNDYELMNLKNGPIVSGNCSMYNAGLRNSNKGFSDENLKDLHVKGEIYK